MFRAQRLTCLWPGLPQLWLRGAWSGLMTAAGFAALLNLTLITTWIWTEWMSGSARGTLWAGVAIVWMGYGVFNWRRLSIAASEAPQSADDLFNRAVDEYLKGNWYEAEERIRKLLRLNPDDADAWLKLATLLRRTGRHDEARRALHRMSRFEAASKWAMEIQHEHLKLEQADKDQPADDPTHQGVEPPAMSEAA